ncbi:MAG: hypothetical protein J6X55_05895 [Victivallales bacterium]|nr:hypothetical protein [Victivallales bacterium]
MAISTDDVTSKKKNASHSLTAEEVTRSMRKINRSKSSAQHFLKEIGVTFSKTGKIHVRPI